MCFCSFHSFLFPSLSFTRSIRHELKQSVFLISSKHTKLMPSWLTRESHFTADHTIKAIISWANFLKTRMLLSSISLFLERRRKLWRNPFNSSASHQYEWFIAIWGHTFISLLNTLHPVAYIIHLIFLLKTRRPLRKAICTLIKGPLNHETPGHDMKWQT